jgi:hypothetical protein
MSPVPKIYGIWPTEHQVRRLAKIHGVNATQFATAVTQFAPGLPAAGGSNFSGTAGRSLANIAGQVVSLWATKEAALSPNAAARMIKGVDYQGNMAQFNASLVLSIINQAYPMELGRPPRAAELTAAQALWTKILATQTTPTNAMTAFMWSLATAYPYHAR